MAEVAIRWVQTFEKALATLDSDEPGSDYYHKDLLAGDVEIEARRLFYSAAHAWVFGGIGWWNDAYFESETTRNEFEKITSELYDAINEAYRAVLNN